MNFGKGEYIKLGTPSKLIHSSMTEDNFLEWINEEKDNGLFFCSIILDTRLMINGAIFWKPENSENKVVWHHPAHELPEDDSEVLVVMESNDDEQKAHYINKEWIDPSMVLGVCFIEEDITKWRYYEE